MAGTVPLDLRIGLTEAAIECAWTIYSQMDKWSYAVRQERERRYADIDLLLEALFLLILERDGITIPDHAA